MSWRRSVLALVAASLAAAPRVDAGGQTPAPAPPRRNVAGARGAAIERGLQEDVRLHPGSFRAHQMLAAFYLQRGDVPSALPHLERAQRLDPSNYPNSYDLAVALLEVGRLDEARAQVAALLRTHDAGELHDLLGDVEERAGNLQKAADAYQRAAHMDPSEEHLFDWGNNLLQLHAYQPAVQVFTAAAARHPKSARLHVGLGIAQYAEGEYQEAVKSFCAAADLAPSDPRPYQFLGEMYGVSPEVSGEITKRLARFVQAHPTSALGHFQYAMSLWKDSAGAEPDAARLRQVEALLARSIALDPTLAKAFVELGNLLAAQQRYVEAIRRLRQAAELQPGVSQVHYRLSQLYQRTGQGTLAARELETFRRLTGAPPEGK